MRGLAISDDVRERVTTCTDLDRLHDWLDRSGTAERAEDLFVEGSPGSQGRPPHDDGPGTDQVPGPSTLRRDYFG
ncbi:hypothetical protein [Streptomyces pseudogriseolus]|uniref:hypothetical protein n=1 Tax=Streptomyces pseudogriseolus TaxID=36817 RepID=UPI003FA3321D